VVTPDVLVLSLELRVLVVVPEVTLGITALTVLVPAVVLTVLGETNAVVDVLPTGGGAVLHPRANIENAAIAAVNLIIILKNPFL
tara:strand:- start:240 stop:494 length:255 start_codon:yes stop_codon:yes gene_type:complete